MENRICKCGVTFRVKRSSRNKFCSRKCSQRDVGERLKKFRTCKKCGCLYHRLDGTSTRCQACKIHVIPVLDREWSLLRSDGSRKQHLIRDHGSKCMMCGISQWLGGPAPIQLDHIDGNADNNLRENLRLLCAMCHALTPTYNGRNVGKFPNSHRAQKMRRHRGPVR